MMVLRAETAQKREADAGSGDATVLPFPPRARELAAATRLKLLPSATTASRPLQEMPEPGARPTGSPVRLRDWLMAALGVSVAAHLLLFVAFQQRFEDDLARAAGTAAAMRDGTITMPIEIVVESTLPSAPAPTDVSESKVETPAPPAPEAVEPEARLAAIGPELPPLPQPVEVAGPDIRELMPPPREVEKAEIAEAPPVEEEAQANVPMPVARPPVPPKREVAGKPAPETRPEAQPSAPSSSSRAASPSRAAAANSAGRAGASGSADSGGRAAISTYQAQVLAHLSRHRVYPPEARRRGVTGTVRVRFSLGADGRVASVSLAGGSGAGVLDRAAIAMVRRASPFPPFPAGLDRSRMNFAAPIRFDLR